MVVIRLTKGFEAFVDDADADLAAFKWCAQSRGRGRYYAVRTRNYKMVALHRIVAERIYGKLNDGDVVDHIDGNPLNNTRSNLRVCSNQQNLMNRGVQRNNTSGYKGVTFRKDRNGYVAVIKVDGKARVIGLYKTAEEAARKYNEAAFTLFGEFAWLNKVA